MSLNPFKSKKKKYKGLIGHDKKSDLSGGGLMASSSPDAPTPVHPARKVSLPIDSPNLSNRSNQNSPLVNTKQSGLSTSSGRGDGVNSIPHISNGLGILVTPLLRISSEDPPLDRKGIIDITVNVQGFLASISKLRKAMEDLSDVRRSSTHSPDSPTYSEPSTPGGDSANDEDELLEHLSGLIQVVEVCLREHQCMQSSDIKDAIKDLTTIYNECKHENPATCSTCNAAIETLIDAFTNSVSEYLTGESVRLENYTSVTPEHNPMQKGLDRVWLSKSHDNLSTKYSSFQDLSQQISETILEDIDQALFGIANSIEVAARYIKTRIKYHKEIVAYLSKRAQIEQRYMQQMTNLGNKTRRTLQEMSEEHPLPLADVFRNSVKVDMRNATLSNATFNYKVGSKLIEPLEHKVQEFDKRRKELTNTWNKEKKKLMESRTVMKNALSKYRFLGQDLSRVKNLLSLDPYGKQAEKRKKEVSDLENRWQEAEIAYKNAVAECNECQYQVQISSQKSILCMYRRMAIDFDLQLQSGLDTYFRLQCNFFTSLPEAMGNLLNDVEEYNVGSEFMTYIRRHPEQMEEPEDYLFEEFDPDAEGPIEGTESYLECTSSSIPNSISSDSNVLIPGTDEQLERIPSPFHAPFGHHELTTPLSGGGEWSQGGGHISVTSPQLATRRARPQSDLIVAGESDAQRNSMIRRNSEHVAVVNSTKDNLSPPVLLQPWKQRTLPPGSSLYSKAAGTHTFKKLRGPARCRECDTYVYFHGQECDICGLACHKKCLESLAIRCGSKRLARKMNTFGVDFQKHLKATNQCIPIIVTRCIEEIDERSLDTRGLYRISCAKTKLEHLCQLFESGAERVDLSDSPSHLIGSCLKLYFRQLPEPILTFKYYDDFITFARECSYLLPCNLEMVTGEKKERALEMLDRLKGLLRNLPFKNYITMARLLHHLNKVSHPDHVKHNFMPPKNLGIVFGPNLLRQRDQVASLALLADMTAQAKAIEIMIAHVFQLFQLTEEKIKELEHEHDDNAFTQEMLVGEETEFLDPNKSPVEVYDDLMARSRTVYAPHETREENVYELGEVLKALALQSMDFDFTKNENASNSLPNIRDSDCSTPSTDIRPLRSSLVTVTSVPLEKMLTPVEERPAAEYADNHSEPFDLEDDDGTILVSSSSKIDAPASSLSRSGSSHSNQGPSISMDSGLSSTKDNISILSDGSLIQSLAATGEKTEDESNGRGGLERKGLSLLRNNDSSTFSDPLPHRSFRTKVASAAEETPIQRIPDSARPMHDIYTRSARSYKRPENATSVITHPFRPLHRRSTEDFSLSCAAILMSNSSDRGQRRKYNVSDKYARYEQHRSATVTELDLRSRRDGNGREGELQSQGEEVDSNTTEGLARERKQGRTEESNVERKPGEGGVERKRLFEIHDLSSVSKQCDSGIDDTPDPAKYFRERIRRLSMPPSDDDVHIAADTKPLSHTAAFASRESGIADSPVPELPTDEVTLHKVQDSPPQQVQSSLSQHQQEVKDQQEVSDRESPRQMVTITQTNSEEEPLTMEAEEELESDSSPILFHLSDISGPRSLDNPSFSRYTSARMPIRDSKLLRASESPHDGVELRYRSISMDKIHVSSFRDKHSEADCRERKDCDGHTKCHAASQMDCLPSSQSTSFVPYQFPAVVPEMPHLNTRLFCSSPEPHASLPSTPRSATLPSRTFSPYAHPPPSRNTRSSSPSPMAKRKAKLGKGLKEKLRPALRVFKITSSSSYGLRLSPIPSKKEEVGEERKKTIGSNEFIFAASYPGGHVERGAMSEGLERRARMVSPEAVAINTEQMPLSSGGFMQRSRSLEDMMDIADSAGECERDEHDCWHTTTIGKLVVLPELKPLSRGKGFRGKAGKKMGCTQAPPELLPERSGTEHSCASKQVEGTPSSSDPNGPNKKRQRLPHFV